MIKPTIIRQVIGIGIILCTSYLHAAEIPGIQKSLTEIHYLQFNSDYPTHQWVRQQASSSMRLLQFTSVKHESELSANIVVYYFGPAQGGTVTANIERWQSQFTDKNGKPIKPQISQFVVDQMPTTFAEFHGNYSRGIGMTNASPILSDHALLAAVMRSPVGNVIYQLWGVRPAVLAQRDDFLEFIKSTKFKPLNKR